MFLESRLDSAAAVAGVQAFVQELNYVRSRPLEEAEVARARDTLLGGLVAGFAAEDSLARKLADAFTRGITLQQLMDEVDAVRRVTAQDVYEEAQVLLDPRSGLFVLTGHLGAFRGHTIVASPTGFVVR